MLKYDEWLTSFTDCGIMYSQGESIQHNIKEKKNTEMTYYFNKITTTQKTLKIKHYPNSGSHSPTFNQWAHLV